MNKRLDAAIDAARRTLDEDAQEDLAAMVERFVDVRTADTSELLTPDQRAELERRVARPFQPGDSERVRAIFAKHGIPARFLTSRQKPISPRSNAT